MSNGIGRVWAVNAEGGDEGRPNGVGPVYIENIDKLGSQLPEPEAGDAGKVLGVLNSDGDIGWVPDQEGMAQVQADWDQTDSSQVSYIANKPTIPTVDQNYNASSPNAQSGAAVAQAIAAIPPTTYTAGNGIAISSSKAISAVGGDGITVTGPSTSSVNLYAPTRGTSVSMLTPLTADLVSMIETGGLTVVPSIDLTSSVEPTVGLYAGICTIGNYNLIDPSQRLVLGQVNLSVTHTQVPDPEDPEFLEDYYTAASNGATLVYDIDDLNSTLSKTLTWADVKASPSNYAIVLLFFRVETSCKVGSYDTGSSSDAFNTGVYTTVTPGAITVTNPVPTPASDASGKVLTVTDTQGNYGWQPVPQELPTLTGHGGEVLKVNSGATGVEWGTAGSNYTAGNGIDITSDTISANLDPKGLKITSGKIDINLAANSGLSYDRPPTSETITVGGNSYYNGTLLLSDTGLLTYMWNASDAGSADTFTLTIPGGVFGFGSIMPQGARVRFFLSNHPAMEHNADESYIDVTDQLILVEVNGETQIGACTITLPAAQHASAGWSSDVHFYSSCAFFRTDGDSNFNGSGSVTATYAGSQSGLKVNTPIEVVQSMPVSPTSGVVYIVTGA